MNPATKPKRQATDRLSFRLPAELLKRVDALVASGSYVSRQEVLRDAIRLLLQQEA